MASRDKKNNHQRDPNGTHVHRWTQTPHGAECPCLVVRASLQDAHVWKTRMLREVKRAAANSNDPRECREADETENSPHRVCSWPEANEQTSGSSENNREAGSYGKQEPGLKCPGEWILVGPAKKDIRTRRVIRD